MSRPTRFVAVLAAAAMLVLAAPSFADLFGGGYRPNHSPEKVNPIWRSWQFTTRGDIVEYSVLGIRAYDKERRIFEGDRDGYKVATLILYKEDKEVYKKVEFLAPLNEPLNDKFISFYSSQGYSSDVVVRVSGEQPFSCVELENDLVGKRIYSEDVPLGGLVYQEDYNRNVIRELTGFKRHFSPAPSDLSVWDRSAQEYIDEKENKKKGYEFEKIFDDDKRGSKNKDKDYIKDNVTDGEVSFREDIDSTPSFFLEKGESTRDLLSKGYFAQSYHLSPRLAIYYTIKHLNENAPEEEYALTKKMCVVNYQGAWFLIETIIDATGKTPEDLQIGRPLVKPFEPSEFSLKDWPAFYIEITSRQLGGVSVDLNQYLVLEGPFPVRKALPNGGEYQEVERRRHDIFLTRDVDPMVGKWQIMSRWYSQETDANGKVLKSQREESYTIISRDQARPQNEQETFENLQAVREHLATASEVIW